MRKKILLFLGLTSVFGAKINAQNNFDERGHLTPQTMRTESVQNLAIEKTFSINADRSYYYQENNNRTTHELNTFLGTTSSANGGFDSLGLYTYKVREKMNGATPYWQLTTQTIPLRAQASLTEYRFVGKSLKTSGTSSITCNVYKKDFTTLLATQTYSISTTYGYKTITFGTPASDNDTIIVVLQMNSVADSFAIAQSHNIWNGYDFGSSTPQVFNTNVPFERLGSSIAVSQNNASILGVAWDDFDFFVFPKFTYSITQAFSSSENDLSICLGDSISFTNSNIGHMTNPILNWYDWSSKIDNNPTWYTSYIFDAGTISADTAYSSDQSGGITFSSAGTHTVKTILEFSSWVVSPYYFSDTATFVVNVHSLPAAPTITPSSGLGICPGQTVDLTSSSASSYLWNNNSTTQTITASSAGNYSLTITDANGCISPASSTTVVTNNPTQNASFSYASNTLCVSGGTAAATLTDQNLTGTFASTSGLDINSSTGLITPNNSTPGQYTVTFISNGTANSCTDTKTQTITITNSPVADFNYSSVAYCNSVSNQTVTFTNGGSAGVFSAGNGLSVNSSNGTINVGQSTPGIYTVTNTINVVGCAVATSTYNVEIKASPTATVNNATICAGGNSTITATPGTVGTYSYDWTVPNGVSNPGNVANFSANTAGAYSVVITNLNTNCASTSSSGNLTVNALPNATVNSTAICTGTSANITATPGAVGVYSYTWTVPNGASNPGSVATITANTAGIYSVVITNTLTQCQSISANGTLTVNQLPAVPTITANGALSFCQGGSVVLTSTSSNEYDWSNQATTQAITVTTSGSYTVTITDGNGCSNSSAGTTVTVLDCAGLEENSSNVFVVYPNPASETLNVNFSSISDNATIELLAVDGKVIETRSISNSLTESFNVTNLNSGVYLVVITSVNGKISQRVIVD